jgi:hypothetical protein
MKARASMNNPKRRKAQKRMMTRQKIRNQTKVKMKNQRIARAKTTMLA